MPFLHKVGVINFLDIHHSRFPSVLQVQIRALLNDTVGTLACGRYSSPDVTMGIILGTGTNCCYIEQVANIKKLQVSQKKQAQESMVINMEWGSYISDLLPMTADDYASDAAGANPGKCFFEKLISGMFMGESVRLPSHAGLPFALYMTNSSKAHQQNLE